MFGADLRAETCGAFGRGERDGGLFGAIGGNFARREHFKCQPEHRESLT